MRALIKMTGDWLLCRRSGRTSSGGFSAVVTTAGLIFSVLVSAMSLASESRLDNKVEVILSLAHSLDAETDRVIESRDDAQVQELAARWARLGYDARQLVVSALEGRKVEVRETPRRLANHAQELADYLSEIASCNADGCPESAERRLWGRVTFMSREFDRKFEGPSE